MKRLLLFIVLGMCSTSFGADILVNNSGQPGAYTTIQAAIDNAVDGDRILASPYNLYQESIVIDKSLILASSVANERIRIDGSITTIGSPSREVSIIGIETDSSIIAVVGSSVDYSNIVNIIDCVMDGYYAHVSTSEFVYARILFNTIYNVNVFHGEIMGNEIIEKINIHDPSGATGPDTIKIIANISSGITLDNDNFFVHAFNNYSKNGGFGNGGLRIDKIKYDVNIPNLFVNNTFEGQGWYNVTSDGNLRAAIIFPNNIDASNCLFRNNCILTTQHAYSKIHHPGTNTSWPKFYYNLANQGTWSPEEMILVEGNTTGNFGVNTLGQQTSYMDQGQYGIAFYDIDLTRNDQGTFGGPYSIDNYFNTNNGRARVYHLEIPFEIWTTTLPTIKADGTHMK